MDITHPGPCIAHLGCPVGANMPLYILPFRWQTGQWAKCTDWKNGSIDIHFAQAGHFDEKFQIFFWPHVVPKWNPNIAWGSLSWFRSIRVRGLAVMGVWKCVNNSIYESPVITQAKTKIDHKLEPMVRLQMTIRIIRRLTSLWLLTKIFWPKCVLKTPSSQHCIFSHLLRLFSAFLFI